MALWGQRKTLSVLGAAALVALSGCMDTTVAPNRSLPPPSVQPQPVEPVLAAPKPSKESQELRAYYARVEQDLSVRGLLRTDGGGPDTLYTDTILAHNFERIALANEYQRGEGLRRAGSTLDRLKKWVKPVRMVAEFGPNVDADTRASDQREVARYAARLGRVTGHPISVVPSGGNFHVLFMNTDDMARVKTRVGELVPNVNPSALRLFDNLPRGIHCLVIAFSEEPGGYAYGNAIAVIRDEHPALLRKSCIHEEIAQGMGLGNDYFRARPSIFNDDDEFALLTSHDEMLLRILYNPALRPGMSAEEVRPIVQRLASGAMEGPS